MMKTAATKFHTRALHGGVMAGFSFLLTLILNVLQVSLLLRYWSTDAYGGWIAIASAATLLTTFDGGHQQFIGNLFNRLYVEEPMELKRALGSALRVSCLTATIQSVAAIIVSLSPSLSVYISGSSSIVSGLRLALVIYTLCWISTGSVGSILVKLYTPTGFYTRAMAWNLIMRSAQFLAILIGAMMGYSLVGTALIHGTVVFLVNMALFTDIWRLFPEFTPWWREGSLSIGLGNLLRSGVLSITSILDGLSLQGVVLIVINVLGIATAPLFTTLRTIANVAMQGSSFLLQPIVPDLTRYYVRKEWGKISATFSFYWFATSFVINTGSILSLLCAAKIHTIWTHGKLVFDARLYGLLLCSVLVRTYGAPFWTLIGAMNMLRRQLVLSVARALVGVGLAIPLLMKCGLWGAGAALLLSEILGSFVLPWRMISSEGRRDEGYADGNFLIPGLSTACSVCAILLATFLPSISTAACTAGGLVVAGLGFLQWRRLPNDVRARLNAIRLDRRKESTLLSP